jgi:hypothetical protein
MPLHLLPVFANASVHRVEHSSSPRSLRPHRGVVLLPIVVRQLFSCRHLVISEDGRVVQQLAPAPARITANAAKSKAARQANKPQSAVASTGTSSYVKMAV